MSRLQIGDRVTIAPERADSYLQPWRNRILKGKLRGTIEAQADGGLAVRWDMPKRAKYIHDWYWTGHRLLDLTKLEP
jgi:hypothetical protein